MKKETAKYIANLFLSDINHGLWNGTGKVPEYFKSCQPWVYILNRNAKLTLSFGGNEKPSFNFSINDGKTFTHTINPGSLKEIASAIELDSAGYEADEDDIVSSYNEGSDEQTDYHIYLSHCNSGDTAYRYSYEDNEIYDMKIINIIRRSDNSELYDTLTGLETILVDFEQIFRADYSAEFITDCDCYMVWFKDIEADSTNVNTHDIHGIIDDNNDYCEWEYDADFQYASCSHGSLDTHRIDFRKIKYCPFCSKEIKITNWLQKQAYELAKGFLREGNPNLWSKQRINPLFPIDRKDYAQIRKPYFVYFNFIYDFLCQCWLYKLTLVKVSESGDEDLLEIKVGRQIDSVEAIAKDIVKLCNKNGVI